MRYAPPQKIALSKQVKKSLIACAVLLVLSSESLLAAPGQIINNDYMGKDPSDDSFKKTFSQSEEFYAIDLPNVRPPVNHSQFLFTVNNGATLSINGATHIKSYTDTYGDDKWDTAVHAFYAENKGTINLKGDIDIEMTMSNNVETDYGMSAVYAKGEGSVVNLGSLGTTTKIWVLADKPDTISAKGGGDVNFISTNNQIVGSFDFFDFGLSFGEKTESKITGTFSGKEAYWFGDDGSYDNTANLNLFNENHGVIDLTFEKGAQWSYLGVAPYQTSKRISNITLQNGGIINLFDKNLKEFWQQIGLWDLLKDGNYDVTHDYVRIGNLKGNGGIFRLDLDAENKTQSDIVYIEGSEKPGQHFIEPYNLERLESITPENILVFALVYKSASEVTFSDKINIEGESLYDYELEIGHSTTTKEDLNREELEGKYTNDSSFVDGTKWFIQRILMSKSSAAKAMTGAGFASYDAANEMDRRDRRLLQTYKDGATGMWVRARHGERGVDNEYNYQLNGASIGIDHQLNNINTLGLAFSYEEGDTDFESVRGKGDMKRYEFAIYNTYDYGAPYLDLVGRLGLISSNYDSYNQKGTLKTSGDFDQKYASLSAEVGYTLMDNNGVFIEPQLQFQVAYLDGYDYSSDRSMKVDVDREVAVLSRIGLRAGKHFDTTNITGEVYSRADVYHQFTDGQDAIFSDPTHEMQETWGTNKTYASIGLGSYLKVNDNWGLQFDIEKNIGGKTLDTWLITGQAKYQF